MEHFLSIILAPFTNKEGLWKEILSGTKLSIMHVVIQFCKSKRFGTLKKEIESAVSWKKHSSKEKKLSDIIFLSSHVSERLNTFFH